MMDEQNGTNDDDGSKSNPGVQHETVIAVYYTSQGMSDKSTKSNNLTYPHVRGYMHPSPQTGERAPPQS